jgi:hypothetical protein
MNKLLFCYKTGLINKEEYTKKLTELKTQTVHLGIHPLIHMHQLKQNQIKYLNTIKNSNKQVNQEVKNKIELATYNNIFFPCKTKKEIIDYHRKIIKNDVELKMEQYKYCQKILKIPFLVRLQLLSQSNTIKEFKAEHNHSDKVTLLEGFIVKKQLEQTSMGNFMFWNEVNSLRKLLPYKHFPKLIAYNQNSLTIYMTYCGDSVTPLNLPYNWKQQLENIKSELYTADVNSNDMILRNTCILNNKIYIIDFGMHSLFKKDVAQSMVNLYNRMYMIESKRKNKTSH